MSSTDSSEDSFAWSTASTGSETGDEMQSQASHNYNNSETYSNDEDNIKYESSKETIPKKKKLKIESEDFNDTCRSRKKSNKNELNNDGDSSERKKKKKYEDKKVLDESLEETMEQDDYLNMKVELEKEHMELKQEKRKIKIESEDFNETFRSRKKSIKNDINNDGDSSERKKKKIYEDKIGTDETSEENMEQENFLNMKVELEKEHMELKQEKRKKKREYSDCDHDETQNSYIKEETKSKKKKKKDKDNEKSVIDESIDITMNGHSEVDTEETYERSPKKKKSKNKLGEQIVYHNGDILLNGDSELTAEETYKKSPKKKKNKRKHSEQIDCHIEDNEVPAPETEEEQSSMLEQMSNKSKNTEKTISDSNIIENTHNYENCNRQANSVFFINSTEVTPTAAKKTQQTPKFSDRIIFETENNGVDAPPGNKLSSISQTSILENSNLSDSECLSNSTDITNEDEIWILKCPCDVDINKFNNVDINLDTKCKVKINGETYCGNLDESLGINILTTNNNEFIIKNSIANGVIHFRKRLPKPFINKDNIMLNNQTNFIPLPETKCRHPLFGSNYEDLINVPLERLKPSKNTFDESKTSKSDGTKKKKKHKRDKTSEIDLMNEEKSTVKSLKLEVESNVPIKKSKKRKHSDNYNNISKKPKKVKLEPDSAEAWESEKVIEKNLFNF